MVGNTLGPEEAFRFARGETVKSSHGLPVKLKRPLDFTAVADHAENLGLAPAIAKSDATLLKNAWGKQVHDAVKAGDPTKAAQPQARSVDRGSVQRDYQARQHGASREAGRSRVSRPASRPSGARRR